MGMLFGTLSASTPLQNSSAPGNQVNNPPKEQVVMSPQFDYGQPVGYRYYYYPDRGYYRNGDYYYSDQQYYYPTRYNDGYYYYPGRYYYPNRYYYRDGYYNDDGYGYRSCCGGRGWWPWNIFGW